MTDETLEFSISEYLDGNLSAVEAIVLEDRFKVDAAARKILDDYRHIDSLMRSPASVSELGPRFSWDQLTGRLSDAVAKDNEDFEFAISQYADHELPAEEVPAFEARLAENPAAQNTVSQHRKLNELLKSPTTLPEIQWEDLASHLSKIVADASEPAPIKLFSNRWIRTIGSLALAACVLMASALGIRGYFPHHGPVVKEVVIGPKPSDLNSVAIVPATGSIQIEITNPEAEQTKGIAIAEIIIGAGPDATAGDSPAFAEGIIIARSPRSLIASNAATAQDGAMTPY